MPAVRFSRILLAAILAPGWCGLASGCGRGAPGSLTDQGPSVGDLPAAGLVAEEPSISGRVLLMGGRPSTLGRQFDVSSHAYCSAHGTVTDSTWKVSADGGLSDVVIAVQGSPRASNLPDSPVLVDQVDCQYLPTTVVLQAGQSLCVRNSDETFHNVRLVRHREGTALEGENMLNVGQPGRGDQMIQPLVQPGIYRLECDIHRWMRAWVVVHEGIHAAVSDAEGHFALNRALADGEYHVTAWHPRFKNPVSQNVQIVNGRAEVYFHFDLADAFPEIENPAF